MASTLAVHLVLAALVFAPLPDDSTARDRRADTSAVVVLTLLPPEADTAVLPAPPERPAPAPAPSPPPVPPAWTPTPTPPAPQAVPDPPPPATQAAPPAPSAEQWAFAGQYTLKNSKAYRHTWGQQVRSMMGTAVAGPEQGMVRFQVEIAADGRLVRLDTLWSTSDTAERLARRAVRQMPQWPATPTGQPLVFERTVSFSPHANDDPPLFRGDCLPDPPVFKNPFAWNGRPSPGSSAGSASPPAAAATAQAPDPQALEDCLKQLPPDSVDAESARDRRVMERWDFDRLGR